MTTAQRDNSDNDKDNDDKKWVKKYRSDSDTLLRRKKGKVHISGWKRTRSEREKSN